MNHNIRSGKLYILCLLVLIVVLLPAITRAEFDLTLIKTINIPDSMHIKHDVCRAFDFNGDSYPELVFTIYGLDKKLVYMYFGGPDFDDQVDLIFGESIPGFGYVITSLGDYNGDGYNDFAVSSPCYNGVGFECGRVCIYFGSSEPDTSADLIIDGYRNCDLLGESMGGGDFNGDGFGDLIAVANNYLLGPIVYIYLGSENPDIDYDMNYNYIYSTGIDYLCAGSDINNDGYDDYAWVHNADLCEQNYIFLGAAELPAYSAFSFDDGYITFLYGDISGDEYEDFVRFVGWEGKYLCLGGADVNVVPDYYMWFYAADPFIYNVSGYGRMLIKHDYNFRYYNLYESGEPFDSIPIATIEYEEMQFGGNIFIGDINADGNEDIAVPILTDDDPDLLPQYIGVYSIISTGIDEVINKPEHISLLSCYPNPFNSSTLISYTGLKGGEIEIYDVTGRLVKTLVLGDSQEGKIIWDATDNQENTIASGIYFIKSSSSSVTNVVKAFYLK